MHLKKRWIGLILFILLLPSFTLVLGDPSEDEDCYTCHSDGNYTIGTFTNRSLKFKPRANFTIDISATGFQVEVWAYEKARDNNFFCITPNTSIIDNGIYDSNSSSDAIQCYINFTAPQKNGSYTLLILARSPYTEPTRVVYLEFQVIITPDLTNDFQDFSLKFWIDHHFLEHLNIYLGSLAVLTLLIGTVLMEIDKKYIKIHGRFALISFSLTTLNILLSLQNSWILIKSWVNGNPVEWGHASHMIIGIVGYFAAIVGLFQGLAGHNMKKWGYIALFSWGFNFIFGIFYWGIGL